MLKLKEGYWYECDRDNWGEMRVMASVTHCEPIPIVAVNLRIGMSFEIWDYDEEGDETGRAEVGLRHGRPWHEAAHEAMCSRGWQSPWRDLPA